MEDKIISLREETLKLILTEHKDEIKKDWRSDIDKIITGIALIISIAFLDYSKYGINIKFLLIIVLCLAVIYTLYGMYNTYKNIKKPFNHKILFKRIQEENLMKEYPHSIILIKNTFENKPNKFLVYYDARWNCKLFLNYKTFKNYDENIKNIKNNLGMDLKIDEGDIRCAFEFDKVHTKYSVSAGKEKCYLHSFYKCVINNFNNKITEDEFTIDGKKYYWMSISEMEADKRIMEVNSDVVKMVKEHNF